MKGEMSDKRSQRIFRGTRLAVLTAIILGSTLLGTLHQVVKTTKPAGVDALCPFGGIEAAFSVVLTGTLMEKVAWSSFLLLAATIVVAIVFRRVFCGQICAFGALQELFARLGKAIFGKRFTVPAAVDKPLRWLKYMILVFIVVISTIAGELVIRPYDPWAAWNHILSVELVSGFFVGLILLVVSLAGSMLYDRFFCKYLCPMGGFLGLINRFGWFRVKRVEETCTHCHACTKACPVNIDVEKVEQVKSSECINCNLCVAACPVKDTLVVSGPKGGSISPMKVLVATVAVFAAVVLAGSLIGGVKWTMKPLTEIVKSGETLDPNLIKGSDTFRSISQVSGIPKELFISKLGITEADFDKPAREWVHRPGSKLEMTVVREFVRQNMKQ